MAENLHLWQHAALLSCPTYSFKTSLPLTSPSSGVQPHLMWSSLEDAGALVDCLSPQADILVLKLLRCAVHRLGNQAALWYLTLQRESMRADKHTHRNRAVKEICGVGGVMSQNAHI